MNIKDLRCFRQVYKEKSISRAAQKLYITPQGLGKNIQNLEKELGTTLFIRTSQGLLATESGHFLAAKADQLIGEFEEIENRIRQIESGSHKLRIGCAAGILQLIPFSLIDEFSSSHRELQVEWCEYSNARVKELLLASEIEFGFIVGDWIHEKVSASPLASCGFQVLVYEGHPLYEKEEISLQELKRDPLLLMNEQFHMYRDIMDACQAQGFTPAVAAKTTDSTFLLRLCRQKKGITIVPDFTFETLNLSGVRAIPLKEPLTWDVYGVSLLENRKLEILCDFEDYLKHHI